MNFTLKNLVLDGIEVPLLPPQPDYAKIVTDQIRKDAESAVKKTAVADLTNGEKFALAFYAGIPMQPPPNPWKDIECDYKWTLTTVPCGFYHNGEKWIVTMRAEDEPRNYPRYREERP